MTPELKHRYVYAYDVLVNLPEHAMAQMQRLGLSERAVAREVGVSNSTINRMLAGKPISTRSAEAIVGWLSWVS